MLEPADGQFWFSLKVAGRISAPVIAQLVAGKIVPGERDLLGFRRRHRTRKASGVDDGNAGIPVKCCDGNSRQQPRFAVSYDTSR